MKSLKWLSGFLSSPRTNAWSMVAQLASQKAQCLRGGRSSGGGADELKMRCLVSSSLQREISIRVIWGSAAWREGPQIILAAFSSPPLTRSPARHKLYTSLNFHVCECVPSMTEIFLFLSWDWWLRPGEASRRLQLQIPVLPKTLGEAGAADRRHTQDGADVRAT